MLRFLCHIFVTTLIYFFECLFHIIILYVPTYNLYHNILLQNWLIPVSENSPGWKGSWKIIWSKLSWKGESLWDFLAACPHLETSSHEDSIMFLGRLLQWILHLTVIFSHVRMKHLPVYSSHVVISVWILMEREPPSSLWLSFKYWNSVPT